jgi:uncharacterized protein YcbX
MIRIDRIYIAPVKSLALTEITRARLEKPGIPGDRAFHVVNAQGRIVTQREHGSLVQVQAAYGVTDDTLELTFPDGSRVGGVVELGEAVETSYSGMPGLASRVVTGDWSAALSEFVGQELRLAQADVPGRTFDAFPLSMCSLASLAAFAKVAGRNAEDGRRFRQNIYLHGAAAHEEDSWIGGGLRVGSALLRVKMADPRCVMTTLSPETGEHQLNTLKIIASYRTDQPKQANFGVYCTVVEPGDVRVGDEVTPSLVG